MLTTAVAKLTHLQVGFLEILAVLLFCVHRLVRTAHQQQGSRSGTAEYLRKIR
jgi:hypothetical protein